MRRRAVPGDFRNPQGLSIDRAGNVVVIVGCTRPPHVQVFEPNGERAKAAAEPFVYRNNIGAPGPVVAPQWSGTVQRRPDGAVRGTDDSEWRYPIDSAVDRDGRVLVLDGHRIKIFDIDGNHVMSFGASSWAE